VEGILLVRDLVHIFFTEAPGRLDRIRCGLAEGDADRVVHAAHAMRGGASGLGAVGVAAACGRVERLARTGDVSGLTQAVDAIELELPRLGQRLEEHLAGLGRQATRL
jgi:two-component system sensor histidine kinase BarA